MFWDSLSRRTFPHQRNVLKFPLTWYSVLPMLLCAMRGQPKRLSPIFIWLTHIPRFTLHYPNLLPYWPHGSVGRPSVDLIPSLWVQTQARSNFLWPVGTQLPRGFSALPIPKIYQKNIINKNSQSDFYLDKLFGHDLDLSTGAPNLQKNFTVHTVNPLLTPPPPGGLLISSTFEGGALI